MRPEPAQPCHFGPGGELFGLYHSVNGPVRGAVLLCPPFGQDMIRSHRVYRQLADSLARQAIAVLRFDYYGSGDSAGNSDDLDWTRCLADTAMAAGELRARSGCARLTGFGARLGGSVALSAAVAARFSELLLWDPVLDGSSCVARLDAMQDALRVDPKRFSMPRIGADAAGQWLGFPVNADLRQRLDTWHAEPSSIRTLVFNSLPLTVNNGSALRLGNADNIDLPSTTSWDELDRLEHAILSPDLIRAVGEHLQAMA